MRHLSFFTLLLLAAFAVAGCSRPWHHPDYTNDKQIEFHYKKDYTDCTVLASDKHPLDKDAQNRELSRCMEEKGWEQKEGFRLLRDKPRPD